MTGVNYEDKRKENEILTKKNSGILLPDLKPKQKFVGAHDIRSANGNPYAERYNVEQPEKLKSKKSKKSMGHSKTLTNFRKAATSQPVCSSND